MRARRTFGFIVGTALLVLTCRDASAVPQPIFSCDTTVPGNYTTCTANCELLTNITCHGNNPNEPGITLTNGADLEMNGHYIEFTANNTNYKSAITLGANSVVKDTDPDNEAAVRGVYTGITPAIKCTSITGTKVTGIRVDLTSSGNGITGCGTVEDNVLKSASTTEGGGITSSRTVSNNHVTGFGVGISATVAGSVVDHNIVIGSGYDMFSNNSGSITGNILLGSGTLVYSTYTATFSDNYCDTTASNCTTCIAGDYCVSADPKAPFAFP